MIDEISEENLKRLGVASETIRMALSPIVERQLDKSLASLETARNEFEQQVAMAEMKVLRNIMRELGLKAKYAKD